MAKDQVTQPKLNSPVLSAKQKLVSAMIGSEADLLFTHPFETAAKLKQNSKSILPCQSKHSTVDIFEKLKQPASLQKLKDLYKGISWSAVNKLSSRTIRYMGQGYIQKEMQDKLTPLTAPFLNETQRKTFFGATSGLMASLIETVVLYPLDIIKTRNQLGATKNEIYHNMNKGLFSTVVRSSFSSAVFFGAFNYFSSENKDKNNSLNNLLASTQASLVTTCLNNPIEVIKTRLQAPTTAASTMGMFAIAKNALTEEGVMVFTKGLLARTIQAPFKIALPFFAFTYVKQIFEEQNSRRELSQYHNKPT